MNTTYVTCFGGSLDGMNLKVQTDRNGIPLVHYRTTIGEIYNLVGYDDYTWRYELASAQKSESK
jgi:hypothetical protein